MKDRLGYYNLLGLETNATQDQIKSAYRKLAKQHHPDLSKNNSDEEFKKIQQAYDVLSDEKKRKEYDHGVSSFFGSSSYDPNINDFFNSVFNIKPKRGKDVLVTVSLTLEEVCSGVIKNFNIISNKICSKCNGSKCKIGKSPVKCKNCNGAGRVNRSFQENAFLTMHMAEACSFCKGSGQCISKEDECNCCSGVGLEDEKRNVVISINKGTQNGSIYCRKGDGLYESPNGPRGDLNIKVIYSQHKLFSIDYSKNCLVFQLHIPFSLAMKGGKITIPTLHGPREIEIPAGIDSGYSLYVKEAGLPHYVNGNIMPMIVEVLYKIPKLNDISEEEKNRVNEFINMMDQKSDLSSYNENQADIENYLKGNIK